MNKMENKALQYYEKMLKDLKIKYRECKQYIRMLKKEIKALSIKRINLLGSYTLSNSKIASITLEMNDKDYTKQDEALALKEIEEIKQEKENILAEFKYITVLVLSKETILNANKSLGITYLSFIKAAEDKVESEKMQNV